MHGELIQISNVNKWLLFDFTTSPAKEQKSRQAAGDSGDWIFEFYWNHWSLSTFSSDLESITRRILETTTTRRIGKWTGLEELRQMWSWPSHAHSDSTWYDMIRQWNHGMYWLWPSLSLSSVYWTWSEYCTVNEWLSHRLTRPCVCLWVSITLVWTGLGYDWVRVGFVPRADCWSIWYNLFVSSGNDKEWHWHVTHSRHCIHESDSCMGLMPSI